MLLNFFFGSCLKTNSLETYRLKLQKNVSFVYSINTIGHWKNALCDGMGKWEQTGTETSYVYVDEHKKVSSLISDGTCLKVIRRKYINGSSSSLHRILIMLETEASNDILDQMFVQYYFAGEEGSIKINHHGNSKIDSSYQRTAQTTKERIQELCKKNKKPKDIFHTVLEEQGGLENVKSGTLLARNKMQISNFKRSVEETVKDSLLECTDMAKQQEKGENRFIRVVGAAPEFFIFMSSDRQLADVNKFCTNNKNFSVLGVDTTFNIGKYFLTITTYRNMMLETKDDTEPVMIGPMLLHQRKGFESYFTIASSMLQACPNLKNIKVFGTDGDVNLSNAFQVCFTDAKHLLCDVHMVDNIKKKLKDLNIKGNVADEYIKDIFGKTMNESKIKGIVDCTSQEMFEKEVELIKTKWQERHPNGQQFVNYFMEYKYFLIKECMSADVQSMCGLGFPPKPYNQNGNECINNVVKTDVKARESKDINPFEFVKLVEKSVKRQENEVKLALIGKGQYSVKEEYRNLTVEENEYWRKTAVQRDAVFKKMLAEPLKQRISDNLDISSNEEEITSSATIISMTANETGIINIPFPVLLDIFEEANTVLSEKGSIVPVPGQNNKAYYILDSKKREPMNVKLSKDMRSLSCEKKCHRWNGYKFCSHVVALAQNLDIRPAIVAKYKLISRAPNMTSMANTNMPSNRGKKGCKSTQIRKGPANKKKQPALEYSEQPDKNLFHLTFLAGLVRRCYGCGQEFSAKNKTPPHDLILKGFDYREYVSPITKTKKKTPNVQNTYYHLNSDCVRKRYPYFEINHIIIHNEICNQLTEGHKAVLARLNIATE